MNIKLNMVNLLLILLVVIVLSYCVGNIVEGMSNSDNDGNNDHDDDNHDNHDNDNNYSSPNNNSSKDNNNNSNSSYNSSYNNSDNSSYNNSDNSNNDSNRDNKIKKENRLVDDMRKKESEISDDLKIYSNLLGNGDHNHDNDNHDNDKRYHDRDKIYDRGDGSWDDYWGMGIGDNRSYDNYNKQRDQPSSIHITRYGKQILATPQNTIDGIPGSHIPAGQEDLYVLKSEVVPPVCPACPNVVVDKALLNKKCEPCPPCARCPEPAFDCKKVPNYSLGQANSYLPRPILNNFSTFGA